jgi:hypothetical protein
VSGGFLELTQDGRTLVVATGYGDVRLFRIPVR